MIADFDFAPQYFSFIPQILKSVLICFCNKNNLRKNVSKTVLWISVKQIYRSVTYFQNETG